MLFRMLIQSKAGHTRDIPSMQFVLAPLLTHGPTPASAKILPTFQMDRVHTRPLTRPHWGGPLLGQLDQPGALRML